MKFDERVKAFLSKKSENTSTSYHSMGTDVLWMSDGRLFFSRLDLHETSVPIGQEFFKFLVIIELVSYKPDSYKKHYL